MASPTDLRGARIVDDASASSESPLRDDTAEFIRELRARAEDGGSDEISKTTASAFDFALPATAFSHSWQSAASSAPPSSPSKGTFARTASARMDATSHAADDDTPFPSGTAERTNIETLCP